MSLKLLSFLNLVSFIFSFGLVLMSYIIFSIVLIYILSKFIVNRKVMDIMKKLRFYIRTIILFYSFYIVDETFNSFILSNKYFLSDRFLFSVVYLFIYRIIILTHCVITSSEIINELRYSSTKNTFGKIVAMDFKFFDSKYRYESFKIAIKYLCVILFYIIFNIILVYKF